MKGGDIDKYLTNETHREVDGSSQPYCRQVLASVEQESEHKCNYHHDGEYVLGCRK
jgi:hypothetical protein